MKLEMLSGVQLGKLVNKREVSPVEVIDYFAERISKRDPSLHAFTYLKVDEAREEAKALEGRLAAGEDVGPFAGVPTALKDFLPSKKGWPNSHGGVKCLIAIDPEDSAFYSSVARAGAIAIGKTNAPAFGFRGTCDNKMYGPTSTPFDIRYNSGGSSGGSAAAVADGMLPFAEGGDGGGSIRIPASWCGCFGFKASVGTVPSVCRPDAWTATHPYCCNGAITRTVEDSATIMEYMANYDPRDPLSLNHGFRKFTEFMKKPLKGCRIAYTPDFDIFGVDSEVEEIVRKAAFAFEEAGAEVVPVHFSFKHTANEYANMWCRSISIDTSIDIELWKKDGFDLIGDHADELPKEFIYWNDIARNSTVMDFRLFNEMRTEILDAQEDKFETFDYILSPVTICEPVLNTDDFDTKGPSEVAGVKCDPLIGFCETFFENYTGNPVCTVPAGLTSKGLPVGLQIIGRKFRDEDVFAAAYTYEQLRPWNYDIPYNRPL